MANSGWGSSGWNFKSGRLQRQLNTSFDPAGGTIGSSNNNLITAISCKTVGNNYCVQTSNTDITYYIIATVPLKLLHDICRQILLTKGMFMRLILY